MYKIANQSIKSSKNAKPGWRKLKNVTDHKIFKISCNQKIKIIFIFCHLPVANFSDKGFHALPFENVKIFFIAKFFDQTRYNEIPISKNKIIQTGAKSQLGGIKPGLFKAVYQSLTEDTVKIEPTIPASSQTIMLIVILNILSLFIKYKFYLY